MPQVYATDPMLGSPSAVWKHLRIMAIVSPVENNKPIGTYLTMKSQSGLMFGIINIIGNFGTVFVDQAYWQSAIAAKPSATYRGYLLGGMCWFTIPFTLATTMGLAAKAFDLPITGNESGSGLVPPAIATHILGQGGAFLILLQARCACRCAQGCACSSCPRRYGCCCAACRSPGPHRMRPAAGLALGLGLVCFSSCSSCGGPVLCSSCTPCGFGLPISPAQPRLALSPGSP